MIFLVFSKVTHVHMAFKYILVNISRGQKPGELLTTENLEVMHQLVTNIPHTL
jgi:hypothetical protein